MILAIDTSTRWLGMALHTGTMLVAEHTWQTANQHSVELPPAIDAMLARAGVGASQLTALAVAQGPGSFTGLRIGLSLAKGMALALGVPLVGASTFDVVAMATPQFKGSLYVVLQAGRGRVHVQKYRWLKGMWQAAHDAINTDWASLLPQFDKAALLSGELDADTVAMLATNAPTVTLAPPAQRLRRAGYLAELAWQKLADSSTPSDPSLIAPIYLSTP